MELARCARHKEQPFEALEAALVALESQDAKQRSGYLLVRAAEVALARADLRRAEPWAARAIELASLLERHSDVALAWVVRADVAQAEGDEPVLQRALEALRSVQASPLSTRAQAGAAGALARFHPEPKEKEHGARHRRARVR